MGHATRSRVMIDALRADGHEVRIVASGRAAPYLEEHLGGVTEIWGLTMAYADNRVRRFDTMLANLRGAVDGWPRNVRRAFRLAEDFAPDAVVSDFESFSYLFARRHRLPVIAVDNIQILDRCRQPRAVIAGHEADYAAARALVALKAPRAFHYVITTFFEPPVARRRTTLVPPILRPEIFAATPEQGDHLLVYQTAGAGGALTKALAATGVECRVYGVRKDLESDERDGNLRFRPFSEATFVDDLRTARGVVAGGGFTLLSEAVQFGKPVLSTPIAGQFEQVLNARWIERLGYGLCAPIVHPRTVRDFVDRSDDFGHALAGHGRADNSRATSALLDQLGAATS